MTPVRKRVAGYVRVSRVGGREGDSFQSPKQQEKAIRAHCEARGLKLVGKPVEELDASGGTMARPKLQHLVEQIEQGKLDGIVVTRLDRFARSVKGGIDTIEQIDAAGGFVQTVEGGIDTSESGGAVGRAFMQILLVFAEWERASKAEGFAAAKQNAIERGVHIAGTPPAGYRREDNGREDRRGARLELDPEKAPAIRAAFEQRAAGATLGTVARTLDQLLPGGPSGGGVWTRGTVARLLANSVYTGEARQGAFRNPDAHEAIVPRQTFDTVQILARRQERSGPGSEAKALLAGLCRCGGCGHALVRSKVATKYLVYRCRGRSASGDCEAPASVMAAGLEEFVTEAALDRLTVTIAVPEGPDVDELQARLEVARAKRLPFEDPDYVQALGQDAALRALARCNEEIADVETELAHALATTSATRRSATLPAPEVWHEMTTDFRRLVLAGMIEGVVVSRAPRGTSLADRTQIVWEGEHLPIARPSRGRPKTKTPAA